MHPGAGRRTVRDVHDAGERRPAVGSRLPAEPARRRAEHVRRRVAQVRPPPLLHTCTPHTALDVVFVYLLKTLTIVQIS